MSTTTSTSVSTPATRPTATSTALVTPTRSTPPQTVVPAGLAGRRAVHDALVDVRPDGTGVMSIHGCVPGIPACTLVSDVRLRP